MVDGNNLLALTVATPLEEKTVCCNREGASPKDTWHWMMCSDSGESRKRIRSACGCSQGKWCDWTYDTYRWRANTRKLDTQLSRLGPRIGEKGGGGGQAGQHKLSSLGQGPTMSQGSQGRAVTYYPDQKKRPLRLCIKSEHCSYHAISAWSGDWNGGEASRDFAHRCTPKRNQAWFFRYPMIETVFWFYA